MYLKNYFSFSFIYGFFSLADEGKICKNVVKPPIFLSFIEVDKKLFHFHTYIKQTISFALHVKLGR